MLLVLWHFVYDAILAPSIRLSIRYKLFTLRDRLRLLKYEKEDELTDPVFEQLEFCINHSIHNLSQIGFGTIYSLKREIQRSPGLEAELKKRIEVVRENKLKEVREINVRLLALNGRSLMVNSGGWLPYAIALVLIILLIALVFGFIARIKRRCISILQLFSYAKDEEYQILSVPVMA